LIIFVAKYKGTGPQAVVGWYRGATVFGTEIIKTLHGHERRYFATTRATDACLLREKVRKTFSVDSPEIGLGRSNISYLYSTEGQPRALRGLPRVLQLTRSISSGDLLALCQDCHSVQTKRKSQS
jgi:hypothetical protein